MDLDLLAESDSDSESDQSNPDTASVRRSTVTAATAGSDTGRGHHPSHYAHVPPASPRLAPQPTNPHGRLGHR